jgi:hypothetical protein
MRSGHTLSGGIIPPASNTMCDLLVHDIRSALAIINGYAQSLQRRLANCQPDPDDVVQGLQRIETAAGGVESLLEELVGRRPGEGHIRSIQRRVEYNTLVNVRKD